MKKIAVFSLIVLALWGCAKNDDNSNSGGCSFTDATFAGKTYKGVWVHIDSSGVDLTNRYNSDTCNIPTIALTAGGQYYNSFPKKCGNSPDTGTWKTYTSNGKNYWMTDGKHIEEVVSFDCNTIVFPATSDTDYDYKNRMIIRHSQQKIVKI